MQLSLAHSPDADDAFMFYALSHGKIDTGIYSFVHVLKDIESLNRAAARAEYDVTALSVFGYGFVARDYVLLDVGASIGEGYGPVVVAKRPLGSEDLRRMKVAVPGTRTTAFLSLVLCLGGVPPFVEVPFDQIIPAVKAGQWNGEPVAAGLIIHEGQLSYTEEGLDLIVDLGQWWQEQTGLPLPLGVNAIRRSLGAQVHQDVGALIRQSIDYALTHREEALKYAQQFARGLNPSRLQQFVERYVNQSTVRMPGEARLAIQKLLNEAFSFGLLQEPVVPDFVVLGE
jgi:1,4-dihydroxy-6-naphthoate synthase